MLCMSLAGRCVQGALSQLVAIYHAQETFLWHRKSLLIALAGECVRLAGSLRISPSSR